MSGNAQLADLTDPSSVVRAIEEFDRLGREAFLRKYGFRAARSYMLRHEGRDYDSKAIVGAAYGLQFPDRGPLAWNAFSGGEQMVQATLNRLGFEVVRVEGTPAHRDEVFTSGKVYSWEEIGGVLGFSPGYLGTAGGMPVLKEQGVVLLITHPSGGKTFDYGDYWEGPDLIYAGRGKKGDQKLEGANRYVAENTHTLLAFEQDAPRHLRYIGSPTCTEHWWATADGEDGLPRRILRFRLHFAGEQRAVPSSVAQTEIPHHRTPRPFQDREVTPFRDGGEKTSPEETLALQEKATSGHQQILRTLAAFLEQAGWTEIAEIPSSVDLWARRPGDRRRVIFEAKTISKENETHQVRIALAQLMEYRFFDGDLEDELCIVTDAPLSDRRIRFLDAIGIASAWTTGDGVNVSGARASSILVDLTEVQAPE